MGSLGLSPAIQRVIWSILAVAGAILLSLFFSIAKALFLAVFHDVRSRMQAVRIGALEGSARFVAGRADAFWRARADEPRAPVVAELKRLNGAIETVGARQVEALEGVERRIAVHVQALRSIQQPDGLESAMDRERIVESVNGASFLGLIFLTLFMLAIGVVNSFLLAIFFREVIGNYRVLPYPLPDLQASNVVATIIFLGEIVSGWAIYRNGARVHRAEAVRSTGAGFFRVTPWVLLAALAIVELAAYSTLSARVNLPARLQIDPGGPFYGFAEYFLAFLGIGLTLLLAYLGHAMAEGIDERRRSRLARDIVKALRHGKDTALEHAAKLRKLIDGLGQTAASFQASIPEEFSRTLGISERRDPVLLTVQRFTLGAMTAPDPSSAASFGGAEAPTPFRPPVRTRGQVWGDLVVSTLLLLGLFLVAVLTALEIVSLLLDGASPTGVFIAWAAGLAVPTVFVCLASCMWSVLSGLRYASPATAPLPERRGQTILGWALVGALTACTLALVSFAVAISGGRNPVLYAMLAILQAVALIALAGFFDRGVVAVVHLVRIAALGLVRAGGFALSALASVVGAACYVLGVLIRIVAIPGDVIRGRLTPAAEPTARGVGV